MHILNITRATKKMTINEPTDFIFKNSYKRVGFNKENNSESNFIEIALGHGCSCKFAAYFHNTFS